MNKTLLFAPCFLDEGERLQRNVKWLNYYNELADNLNYDEILLVDNGSKPESLWKLQARTLPLNVPLTIEEHDVHLPRIKSNAYGFWYYAFGQAVKYAMKNNYEKILHCDTDVYILNQKMIDWCNNTNTGWTSLWCSMHGFPETTFQIIGKDQFKNAHKFFTRDFLEFYPFDIAETRIPWTHIEKGFNGDRFGEKPNKPDFSKIDWTGQTPVDWEIKFNG